MVCPRRASVPFKSMGLLGNAPRASHVLLQNVSNSPVREASSMRFIRQEKDEKINRSFSKPLSA